MVKNNMYEPPEDESEEIESNDDQEEIPQEVSEENEDDKEIIADVRPKEIKSVGSSYDEGETGESAELDEEVTIISRTCEEVHFSDKSLGLDITFRSRFNTALQLADYILQVRELYLAKGGQIKNGANYTG